MTLDNPIIAKALYKEMLKAITNTLHTTNENDSIDIKTYIPLSREVVEFMEKSNELNYYAVNYYDTDDICLSHSANVAIFSIIMGKGFNYSEEQLIVLCIAGLLHDIGFINIPGKILQKNKDDLTEAEKNILEKHSELGSALIKKESSVAKYIANIVKQHHEKYDGSGYPDKLIGEKIKFDAQIISLIDTYEALIHPREKRDSLFPPVGINQILTNEGSSFNRTMLRTLVEHISIYPIGVYVKLCSNEIGKVVETNKKNPMRPKVEILYDSQRKKIIPHIIDLQNEPLMHIEKCVPLKKK